MIAGQFNASDRGRRRLMTLAGLLLAAAAAAGCSAPTVRVSHSLAPDVQIPRPIELGQVRVEGDQDGFAAQYLRDSLLEALAGVNAQADRSEVAAGAGPTIMEVSATLELTEETASRAIRIYVPADGQAIEPRQVQTLRRAAALSCTMDLGQPAIRLGTASRYDSAADPRLGGELGLHRPDAPVEIPEQRRIVRQVVDDCVQQVGLMLSPTTSDEQVQLRRSWHSGQGLSLAAKGKHAQAADSFASAAEKHPDDKSLLFNLGVMLEATGQYEQAAQHYQRLAQLLSEPDADLNRRLETARAMALNTAAK